MVPGPEGFSLWVESGNTVVKEPVLTNAWKGVGRLGGRVL